MHAAIVYDTLPTGSKFDSLSLNGSNFWLDLGLLGSSVNRIVFPWDALGSQGSGSQGTVSPYQSQGNGIKSWAQNGGDGPAAGLYGSLGIPGGSDFLSFLRPATPVRRPGIRQGPSVLDSRARSQAMAISAGSTTRPPAESCPTRSTVGVHFPGATRAEAVAAAAQGAATPAAAVTPVVAEMAGAKAAAEAALAAMAAVDTALAEVAAAVETTAVETAVAETAVAAEMAQAEMAAATRVAAEATLTMEAAVPWAPITAGTQRLPARPAPFPSQLRSTSGPLRARGAAGVGVLRRWENRVDQGGVKN